MATDADYLPLYLNRANAALGPGVTMTQRYDCFSDRHVMSVRYGGAKGDVEITGELSDDLRSFDDMLAALKTAVPPNAAK